MIGDKDAQSPRSGPLHTAVCAGPCLQNCSLPPTPTRLLLHVAAFQKPRSRTGLVLAFKASRRHRSSETKTCAPPSPARRLGAAGVPAFGWKWVSSGGYGRGPATGHVCVGATARPRTGHRVRGTVLLAARGPVGVASRPLPPAQRSSPTYRPVRKAGPKTQEAPLVVADSRTLEGDSCSDINAGPARAWPVATRSCAGASK